MSKSMKILLVLMCLVLTVFVGCSSQEAGNNASENTSNNTSNNTSSDAEKPAEKAEKFPSKPLELIVPYSAGGGTDTVARAFASVASSYSDVPIRVVVMPGSGGAEGSKYVADAEPDGYKINIGTMGSHLTTPLLEDVGYTTDSFIKVASVSEPTYLITVSVDSPFNTFEELIEQAKANPGTLSYGSSGAGGSAHFGMEILSGKIGIELKHVPFNGSSEAIAQTMGGNVDLSFPTAGSGLKHVTGGKLKALAVTGKKRLDALPDVPTIKELGYDYVFNIWRGMFLPVGTPEDRVKYWENLIKQVSEDETFIKLVTRAEGIPPEFAGTEAFTESYNQQVKEIKPIADKMR
jgi:tripartite-type tricarboxylate transporter receptor subunit TctC